MPDKFDPYRESLIMETQTIWPDGYEHLDAKERARVEAAVHDDPEQASSLEYVRVHTGFCRTITITDEDLERIG